MKIPEAVRLLQVLLVRDADCRCGNHQIDEQEQEAIKVAVEALEDIES